MCETCDSFLRPNVVLTKDQNFNTKEYVQKKNNFDNFLLENLHKSITVLEIGVGIYGKTAKIVGDSLLRNSKNLSYIIINPRGQ